MFRIIIMKSPEEKLKPWKIQVYLFKLFIGLPNVTLCSHRNRRYTKFSWWWYDDVLRLRSELEAVEARLSSRPNSTNRSHRVIGRWQQWQWIPGQFSDTGHWSRRSRLRLEAASVWPRTANQLHFGQLLRRWTTMDHPTCSICPYYPQDTVINLQARALSYPNLLINQFAVKNTCKKYLYILILILLLSV